MIGDQITLNQSEWAAEQIQLFSLNFDFGQLLVKSFKLFVKNLKLAPIFRLYSQVARHPFEQLKEPFQMK